MYGVAKEIPAAVNMSISALAVSYLCVKCHKNKKKNNNNNFSTSRPRCSR